MSPESIAIGIALLSLLFTAYRYFRDRDLNRRVQEAQLKSTELDIELKKCQLAQIENAMRLEQAEERIEKVEEVIREAEVKPGKIAVNVPKVTATAETAADVSEPEESNGEQSVTS